MELTLDKVYALLAHFLEKADNDLNCDDIYYAMYLLLELTGDSQDSLSEDYED